MFQGLETCVNLRTLRVRLRDFAFYFGDEDLDQLHAHLPSQLRELDTHGMTEVSEHAWQRLVESTRLTSLCRWQFAHCSSLSLDSRPVLTAQCRGWEVTTTSLM